MKAKINMGVFGAAPSIDALPKIKGTGDAVAVATAIGAVGGGVQRLLCSTSFYFGALAKAKGEKLNFGAAWEGFYSKFYADSPLSTDSKKNAKKDVVVYCDFAQLAWDTQDVAGMIFDWKHGSLGQKASTIRKVIDKFADKAPTPAELADLMPKPKASGTNAPQTIKAKGASIKASIAGVREDKALWKAVTGNAELKARYETLEAAAVMFAEMAKTITDMKAKKAKGEKATADNTAALAAALKAKPAKGARLN